MTKQYHIIIEEGLEKGLKITVPQAGVRVGRAPNNDIVLSDPALSRYNNRFFFKPGDGLWVSDLGSVNGTLVNGRDVTETRLHTGDSVLIGDTTMRVVDDGSGKSSGAPVIDLGFGKSGRKDERRKTSNISLFIILVCLGIALLLVVWGSRLLKQNNSKSTGTVPVAVVKTPETLEVNYEKVIADTNNIFRYYLSLTTNRIISVQIDDLVNGRHVRKEGAVEREYINELIRELGDTGFYKLDADYRGIQPDIYNLRDLTITIGKKTHRTIVFNRVEPDIFRLTREILEEAGRNELGLWAIQFSAEKLQAMANTAYLLGKKLYDERDVKYGNMAAALKSFKEAEWYLETVDPKPVFYSDVISYIRDCKTILDQKYENQNFLAERAIKLRDWEQAAEELRILCEIIPDRDDKRNQAARKKLLDIESRIRKR